MRYLLKAPKSEYTQVYVCNTLCCLQTRSSKRVLLIFTALQMVLFSMCLFIAHTLPILQASLPNIICTPFCARFCQFFPFQPCFATSIFAKCCYLNFHHSNLCHILTLYTYFATYFIFTYFAFIGICREKNLMFPLSAVASCKQLLFISHNFALLFSLGMRQGPKDLKLT